MSQYTHQIAQLYKKARKFQGVGNSDTPAQCGFIAVRDHEEWKRFRGGK